MTVFVSNQIAGIQHHGNPLHLYCRLRDFGVSKKLAMRLGKIYELLFKHIIY